MNNTTRTIRSEEITIDMRVLTIMEDGRKNGEIYLAAIAPNMELTVITLDEAPDILPCFDEDDACVNIPDSTLMLCYNPAQVLELGGKHYLTGPVILMRIDMDGDIISLSMDELYRFQKYLAGHSITLMPAVPSSLVLRTTCSSRSPMWKWSRPFRKRWIISTTAARTAGIFCGKTR